MCVYWATRNLILEGNNLLLSVSEVQCVWPRGWAQAGCLGKLGLNSLCWVWLPTRAVLCDKKESSLSWAPPGLTFWCFLEWEGQRQARSDWAKLCVLGESRTPNSGELRVEEGSNVESSYAALLMHKVLLLQAVNTKYIILFLRL